MVKLECFFDCSSPWTYLGFHNLQPMAARLGVEVIWKPIIVGGVFNKVNMPVYENRANPPVPRKAEYTLKDMQDWARLAGLVVNHPPACGHPVNAVKCMRGCIAVQPTGKLIAFATAAFEALWRDGRDLAQDEVLADICRAAGVDPDWLLAKIAMPELKQALWDNTNALMDRNGFGSPTFFVNEYDMYFGNDRLVLVEAAIVRAQGRREAPAGVSWLNR
jgi:2-hydroxychromene-2-carboxylate isomerase